MRGPGPGDRAPDAALATLDGARLRLRDLLPRSPFTLLVFLRHLG